MKQRFSSQELKYLRNNIPIERVITSYLSIPIDHGTDKLRFACPLCHGFATSIHPKENLARCFSCQRNFNPIEIVMHHLKYDFVESVKWLKQHTVKVPTKNQFFKKPTIEMTLPRKSQPSTPSPIGDILTKMSNLSTQEASEQKSETIEDRISSLEKKVDQLYSMIKELRSGSSY